MMRLVLALISGVVLAGPANADTLSSADPAGLLGHLQGSGVNAQLNKDDFGDPKIDITQNDTTFSIYFYGCTAAKNCTSMQFFVGYRTEDVWSVEHANTWNKERRFTRSYVSEEGSARLEMDLFSGTAGLSVEAFTEYYQLWSRNMVEFEEVIGW